ncbi:MAG: hypothetical protein COB67_05935 [SAR324 cluster bacterium]|uniref:Amidoligase enzyme n=1 Tax=SAR324 cluster bacterium TaxID=2024889 RepID=A0A2A4T5T8_9DELT|nr:MAG: hypothetical protein COB67_05935 [SAR324 cluster bacterium]
MTIEKLDEEGTLLWELEETVKEVAQVKMITSELKLTDQVINSDMQAGVEFEFYSKYIDPEDFETFMVNVIEAVSKINDTNIISNLNRSDNSIHNPDYKMFEIKRDDSLVTNAFGIEMTTPKTKVSRMPYYIDEVFRIIRIYGSTDATAGVHLNLSLGNTYSIDFWKFILLMEHHGLLSSWTSRICSTNVMDLLNCIKEKEAKIQKGKRTGWNVELKDSKRNFIEIRTIGGEDYEYKSEQVIKELQQICEIFISAATPGHEQKLYDELKLAQDLKVAKISKIKIKKYNEAMERIGIEYKYT